MQGPKVAFIFFCLVIFVAGESQPKAEDYLGEFKSNNHGLVGKAYKSYNNLLITDFTFTETFPDARFFVGSETNRWNETYVQFKRTGQDSDFQTIVLPSIHNAANIEINLNYKPVEELTYLSVVSNQQGMLGYIPLNSGSSVFKPQQVIAVVFAAIFSAFYLH